VLDVAPAEDEFEFRSTVVGGRMPREYVRAVEAGCRDALSEGLLGGHCGDALKDPFEALNALKGSFRALGPAASPATACRAADKRKAPPVKTRREDRFAARMGAHFLSHGADRVPRCGRMRALGGFSLSGK
jgi:hypothetical protein